jgi:hypothetical protein
MSPVISLPHGPSHYWKEMQARSEKGFTIRDVAYCSEGVTYAAVKDYVTFLLKDGYVVKIGERNVGYTNAGVYSIRKNSRHAPIKRRPEFADKRGRMQLALWTAMRTLSSFTLPELQASASTEELPIKLRTAEQYVRSLTKAGAVEIVEPYRKGAPGAPGARAGIYRLARTANSGPAPLKIFNASIVFDPNKNRVLGEAVVTEPRS